MPALPENILSQLVQTPQTKKLAQAYITPIDLAEGEEVPWAEAGGSRNIAFQYWPESITDSRPSPWGPMDIPGGSHPLRQWSHGGDRRISFVAHFTTDTDPGDELALNPDPYGILAGGEGHSAVSAGLNLGIHDVDIRQMVSWLRYFTYPLYSSNDLRVFEPPKCLLTLPNSGIAHTGLDYVLCVMEQCDVTYEASFANGMPRCIEVQLEFAETVQRSNGVRFHNRRHMRGSRSIPGTLRP